MYSYKLAKANNGVTYGYFPTLKNEGLTHAISTRLGGISKAPYNTLNLGFNTDDDSENILKNRDILMFFSNFVHEKIFFACV